MVTLDDVFREATRNSRACPNPWRWKELYDMLPDTRRSGLGWAPPLPLILAAWHENPARSKMLRLREHIEWADGHGCLDEVSTFLTHLSEDDWHHFPDVD